MLGPEHFTLIVVVLMTVGILGVLIIGTMYRRQAGTPPRARARRDVIAEGRIRPEQLATMHAAENARLRAHGCAGLSRRDFESRVVGDPRFKRRVMRLRLHRRPERARRLA
jgi:hypothetical protein